MGWDFARELRRVGAAVERRDRAVGSAAARAYCARVAKTHYENFTVASLLLPRRLVRHFHAVYAYCRWSDDLADETAGGSEALDLHRRGGAASCSPATTAKPRHPVMVALRETIRRFDIPPEPFLNLLVAFEQDQRVKRYETFDQLLGYCRNSANPVGHLVLYLFECFDAEARGAGGRGLYRAATGELLAGRGPRPRDRPRLPAGRGPRAVRLHRRRPRGAAVHAGVPRADAVRGGADAAATSTAARRCCRCCRARRGWTWTCSFAAAGRSSRAIERNGYDVWSRRPEVTKCEKAKLLRMARLWYGRSLESARRCGRVHSTTRSPSARSTA